MAAHKVSQLVVKKEGTILIIVIRMYELIELYDTQPQTKKINLEFKNIRDLTPMMAVLSKFRFLSEISLHGNKISSVPSLDSIRNLRAIDLSNNPIKIDKCLLDRLHQSPKLEELYIDCSREEREVIVQNMPNLKSLNGETILRQRYVRQTLEEELRGLQAKLSDEMKRMKETYTRLASSLEPPDSPRSNSSAKSPRAPRDDELNLIYKDIQEEMSYFYSGLQDRLSRQGVFAYCKNKLTTVLDNLMVRILDENASEPVVKIYEEVSRIKAENFDFLLRIILNASYERHVNEEVEKPTNRLRKETVYQNEIFRLKKEIAEMRQEQAKMQQLSEKEQAIFEKKIRPNNKSPVNARTFERSASANKLPNRSPSNKTLVRTPSKTPLSRSPSAKVTTMSRVGGYGKSQNIHGRGGKGKTLTLEQLSKLIEEIMAEKRKFNLRSLSKNEPFETSQEFIFTFFTRKYGLKEVALQWSLALIKAIEQFCKESIQVQIFGKILKNQLYEEYHDEFRAFGRDIEKAYKQSKMDRASVPETLFRKLFFYFFSYENEDTFTSIAKTFAFPITSQELTYFLQSYKLAFEEKHLASFLNIFRKIDSDDDSSLTAKEAKELLQAVIRLNKGLSEQAASAKFQEYSAVIDTFRKNKFIFSEVFQLAHTLL